MTTSPNSSLEISRVSGFVFRVSCFVFWVLGLNSGVSDFGFQVLDLGSGVWGLGCGVSGGAHLLTVSPNSPRLAFTVLPCRRSLFSVSHSFSSSLLLSSLDLGDTQVYTPAIRALLGTASYFCEVVVLTRVIDRSNAALKPFSVSWSYYSHLSSCLFSFWKSLGNSTNPPPKVADP